MSFPQPLDHEKKENKWHCSGNDWDFLKNVEYMIYPDNIDELTRKERINIMDGFVKRWPELNQEIQTNWDVTPTIDEGSLQDMLIYSLMTVLDNTGGKQHMFARTKRDEIGEGINRKRECKLNKRIRKY